MGFSIGKLLGGVAKTAVNLGASAVTGGAVKPFSDPFGTKSGTTTTTKAVPSDYSPAAEQAAYEGAWFGDRPDLFQKLQSWGAQGVASAARGANDLLARGWYGGTRSGDYANATSDGGGTVNIGQGPRRTATVASVVNAAVTAAGQAVAAQIAPDVVPRPLGVAAAPTNTGSTFSNPLFLIGGGLVVVVLLFLLLRK